MTASECDASRKTVRVVGDSIVMGMSWDNPAFLSNIPPGYETTVNAFMGDTASKHQETVEAWAAEDQPERLVIELGTNEAMAGGWTSGDRADYQRLVDAAPDRTCVVAILPATTEAAAPAAEVRKAAAAIREIVMAEPRHQIIDFAGFVAAHPTYFQDDGIHLITSPDVDTGRVQADAYTAQQVVDAYSEWLSPAITACQGGD